MGVAQMIALTHPEKLTCSDPWKNLWTCRADMVSYRTRRQAVIWWRFDTGRAVQRWGGELVEGALGADVVVWLAGATSPRVAGELASSRLELVRGVQRGTEVD